MIKRTIIAAFIFLGLYILYIQVAGAGRKVSQHQWQDNQIKAEDFIYSANMPRNVIVGSSLSCRLVMDSLRDYGNLAFNGQSIYEGLNILDKRTDMPENVYIEMNVIFRSENMGFSSALFNPFVYEIRKDVSALRDGNQPVARMGASVTGMVTSVIKGMKKALMFRKSAEPAVPAKEEKLSPDDSIHMAQQFKKLVDVHAAYYSILLDSHFLKTQLDKLHDYITPLVKRGVHITFFEMPVDARLCNMAMAVQIRKAFLDRFPGTDGYDYILQPQGRPYRTSDGVHLVDSAAAAYTSYFKQQSMPRMTGVNNH